ncbi:MAG: hypothetical protein JJ850_15395 [Kordiimonadaceae bacterium]|nr:hypothetical protein [Kordiimonadaceae bacterium]MBO6569898.1 hypothetical protein [Kordiimonadaceae bacterium]MBO6966006.1 hypothetical protein [Kordiimonadaceae bacterium]
MTTKINRFAYAVLATSWIVGGAPAAHSQEGELLRLARDSAIIAGGGKYCRYDPDEIESFSARSEARLSVMARDDYEKVLARLEFKNMLDAYSAREPEGGCENFKSVFDRALKSIR